MAVFTVPESSVLVPVLLILWSRSKDEAKRQEKNNFQKFGLSPVLIRIGEIGVACSRPCSAGYLRNEFRSRAVEAGSDCVSEDSANVSGITFRPVEYLSEFVEGCGRRVANVCVANRTVVGARNEVAEGVDSVALSEGVDDGRNQDTDGSRHEAWLVDGLGLDVAVGRVR